MTQDLVGTTIDGRYDVLSLLGTGGLGTVYKAQQPELNRQVAVKVLHGTALASADSRLRFEREAKILSTLHHEHIVGVYSFGLLTNGSPYMVMELVEGKTLDQVILANKQLGWKRVTKIGVQSCQALAAAHKTGIIHRDLKPQNIMLVDSPTPDTVKVLDFGLSRLVSDSAQPTQHLTQTGALIGSIHYMSPEICAGRKADERSDIYSLGCMLYECLAGNPPFESEHAFEMLHKHMHEMPPSLSSLPQCKDVPKQLEYAVFKCLQKDPLERFSSMEEFLEALSLIDQGRAKEVTLSKVQMGKRLGRKGSNTLVWIAACTVLPLLASVMFIAHDKFSTAKAGAPVALSRSESQLVFRKQEIARADKLADEALSWSVKGNASRTDNCVKRALGCIGHHYEVALSPECSEADIAVLKKLAQACQRIPPPEEPGNVASNLDAIELNANLGISTPARQDMTIAQAHIYAKYSLCRCGEKFLNAIQIIEPEKDPVRCESVLNEAEKEVAHMADRIHEVAVHLALARATYYAGVKNFPEAKKWLDLCAQDTEYAYPLGMRHRYGPKLTSFQIEQKMDDPARIKAALIDAENAAKPTFTDIIANYSMKNALAGASAQKEAFEEGMIHMQLVINSCLTPELKKHATEARDKVKEEMLKEYPALTQS